MSTKTRTKFFAFLVFFVFFAIIGFGLSHSLGMEMKSDGTMNGCLFTGAEEFCPMTLVAHIAAWQQLFVAIPQKIIASSLIIVLLVIATIWAWGKIFPRTEQFRCALTFTLYLRAHPAFSFYNTLRELFARGILHPRIYSHTIF